MRSLSPFLLSLLLITATVSAQERAVLEHSKAGMKPAVKTGDDASHNIHITPIINGTLEAKEALRAFHAARRAGTLPRYKTTRRYRINTDREFNVRVNVTDDFEETQVVPAQWEKMNFTLVASGAAADVWVAADLVGTFSEDDKAALNEAILNTTPEASYRPDHGIIDNNNDLFGEPPDYDDDGKLDVLLHDITEPDGAGCCILGYVNLMDIYPDAPDTVGNQADILYVDLPDGLQMGGVYGIASTIAHEYQHLINFNYQDIDFSTGGGLELTFVNEGLSEWAQVVNGYFDRNISYLSDPSQHNVPLLDFRIDEPIEIVINDYERAGLFTTYMAQRIGNEATGSIVRAMSGEVYVVGADGYEVVLETSGLTLEGVVTDFHTANLLNDSSVDETYGYALPEYSYIKANPTILVDGATGENTVLTDFTVNSGAVQYISWMNVADFNLTGDIYSEIAEVLKPGMRTRMRLRVVLHHTDSLVEVHDVAVGPEAHLFKGEFDRVTVAVIHQAVKKTAVRFDVFAGWSQLGGGELGVQTIAYDSGRMDFDKIYLLDDVSRQASRFVVPADMWLSQILVAPLYMNQLQNVPVPDGEPRDFRLSVWVDDGTGLPGDELFGIDVIDDPLGTHIDLNTGVYFFLETVLSEGEAILSNLPDTVYIGMSNIGTDENYLALNVSEYTGEHVSYLYLQNFGPAWASFDNIVDGATGDRLFENRVLPIRVKFQSLQPVAAAGAVELPDAISLDQNFPNPFNPGTAIQYSLPQAMDIQLAVYDVMGRRLSVLVDSVQPAGIHEVRIDASNWASGLYLYTLKTPGGTLTKRMVVLK